MPEPDDAQQVRPSAAILNEVNRGLVLTGTGRGRI